MKKEEVRMGDLLFLSGQSDMEQAIQTTTGHYSHVAIYLDGQLYHASQDKGVCRENWQDFWDRDKIYHVYRPLLLPDTGILEKADSLLGQPYNASFSPKGQGYYCSQFIAAILPLFETVAMEFGDEKGPVSPFWQDYFDQLGQPIPLGEEGTNPSQLAASPFLEFKGVLDD